MADAAPEHTPTLDEDKVQPDLSKVSASGTPVKDTTAKVIVEKSDETPDEEETSGTSDEKETEPQEDGEEKPIIKLETAPADFRFPTTNQTRHCFTRYIEYHRCIPVKGEGAPECEKFAKYYRSLCPSEWEAYDCYVTKRLSERSLSKMSLSVNNKCMLLKIERWNEQRQNGTFPGPL